MLLVVIKWLNVSKACSTQMIFIMLELVISIFLPYKYPGGGDSPIKVTGVLVVPF